MKDKYIEEEYPVYFVWGKRVDGRVDIATTSDDTVATVSQEHAEKLIQDRNDLVRRLCDMAQAFDRSSPEEFKKFWYGSCLAQPEPVAPPMPLPGDAEGLAEVFWGRYDQPKPVAPTDVELRNMWLSREWFNEGATLREFASIIRRWGTPAIQPVPVSERLPGARDCDGEGRCWIFMPDIGTDPSWRLTDPRDIGPYHTHSLPHHALPTPEAP
jgi:hypothetical protein